MNQTKFKSRTILVLALPFVLVAMLMVIRVGGARAHSAAVPAEFVVTNLNDSGEGSLRDAIDQANMTSGPDIITFQDELTGTILLTSGELLITDDLTISGPGIFSINVSGNHQSRVFEINSGITVDISGLTISDSSGSGILNSGALSLNNVVLSGNAGGDSGGGIYNNGNLTITNSTLSGNSAINVGGGIYNIGTLTISNSTLSGNSSNVAAGGIFNAGNLTITNATVSGNSSTDGGGIYNIVTANISFTTVSGNSASKRGGGIFNNINATINIKNSIVANSTSGGDCYNNGTINASGVNFTTDGTCPGFTQVTPAQLNLGPLADNGGPTQTHALLPGSVAIDSAKDCTPLDSKDPLATDQRGIGRPQGAACDAGSFEAVPCTTKPSIFCPEDFMVSTDANQCAAKVDYSLPPADCPCSNGSSKPSAPTGSTCSVVCSPPPGTNFPRGTTTVTCMVTDINGNTASCSFTITVTDQVPPALSCPSSVTKSTDPNQCQAVVNYTVTANDNCDGPRPVMCSPPSGSTFQKGTTTVTCTASDSSKNVATCMFPVTVNDMQPPAMTCPANVTKSTDPNQCSAVVTYPGPTGVSDNCPGVGTPSCSPPSGSTFQRGTTTVTCMVQDASGNTTACSFTVTVNDTQPPLITCPANVTAVAGNTCPPPTSAVVTFPTPTASDNCPGVTVACNPPSGSAFPVGTRTVTCTATDTSGNTASCSFAVAVFSGCLQDDANPSTVVLFNALTGDYRFCCNGTAFTGKGTVTVRGCVVEIQHNPVDRRVLIKADFGAKSGTASLQVPPGKTICTITDRNTGNNTCQCP